MSAMDDRKKVMENKFFRDEEMHFKVISRRRKLLGLWAAGIMHLSEEESLEYALEIVKYGIENSQSGAVVSRIITDIKAKGFDVSETEVREKMVELEEYAAKQILEEYNNG